MTKTNRILLDERNVKALKPQAKSYYVMDSKTIGFGLRVTPAGVKTLVLRYRFHGRQRWHKIGMLGDETVTSARDYAQKLKSRIRLGEDPEKTRQESREVPTFKEICQRYIDENGAIHGGKKYFKDAKAMFENCIYPQIGNRRVSDCNAEDLKRLHRKLSSHGLVQANRMLQALRAAYHWSECTKWVDSNPFKKFPWHKETRRWHYLNATEKKRLLATLETHSVKSSAYAIKLIMYTGARLGEVLSATWQQFDFDGQRWTKPANLNKSGKQIEIPLSDAAMRVLREIKAQPWTGEVYLFPGEEKAQTTLKKSWQTIRENAKLVAAESGKNVRIHDLRHTFASDIIEQGFAASVVTACLGHLTPGTAHRYIHVNNTLVRNAVNAVGNHIDEQKNRTDEPTA